MKRFSIWIAIMALCGLVYSAHGQMSASPQQNQAAASSSPSLSASADRVQLIVTVARQLRMRNPEGAVGLIPESVAEEGEIVSILKKAIELDGSLAQGGTFCESGFVGGPIAFSSTTTLRMDDLLTQIHRRFGVNFMLGDGVADLPVNIRSGSLPWNELLNSQLFLSGVRARCSGSTVQLIKNTDLPKLQDTAEVKSRFIKLKFLQPASQSNVDVAGRSGGGSGDKMGNFEKLVFEIEKILGIRSMTASSSEAGGGGAAAGGAAGGGGGGAAQVAEVQRANRSVSQIPGRNILVVRGTDEELELVNQIIERADRPPFQIVVKGLVYTANESKALDLGIQSSIVASTAALRTSANSATGTGGTTGGTTGSTGTGGTSSSGTPVRSFGVGYQSPAPGNLFDVLALVGTVDFNIQANALATKGVIAVKSRPFAMVLDGQEAELNIGRQIPVIIQAQNSTGGAPGTLDILEASNILNITPFVIDDEKGQPMGVNLGLRLEANDVDLSVTSQGVPSVNRQSIQTNILLSQEKTIILGGFTVDSDSETKSKIPGLGDIPGIGWLFKRKVNSNQLNRLYFAISVTVVPFGTVIQPVDVKVTTDIPTPGIK